jgi:hypothetical protein
MQYWSLPKRRPWANTLFNVRHPTTLFYITRTLKEKKSINNNNNNNNIWEREGPNKKKTTQVLKMAKVNQGPWALFPSIGSMTHLWMEPKLNGKPLMNSLVDEAQPMDLSSIHLCNLSFTRLAMEWGTQWKGVSWPCYTIPLPHGGGGGC